MLRVRLLTTTSSVPAVSTGRTYEVLEVRDRRAWSRQRILIVDDTGAQVWHLRSLFVPEFSLWLEFELWPDPWDPEANFANVNVTLSDGRFYAMNVWTYAYFAMAREENLASGENLGDLYLLPPDLFVARLTRHDIERTVEHLLQVHEWSLPEAWRYDPT